MSAGLQHLDQLVEDIILGKSNVSLQGPVVILPAAPGVPSAAPAAALSTKASSKKPATSSKKTSKRKACADDTATKSSAKKPRSTKKLTASTLPSYDFAKLLEDLHRAHRRAFWEWAFHVPLESSSAQSNRRKLKMRATLARLSFTSLCIEPGASTRSSRRWRSVLKCSGSEASPASLHPEVDSTKDPSLRISLSSTTKIRPDTRPRSRTPSIRRRWTPYGYPQVLSFLEFTEALNPKAIAKNRLSMTALARIRQDLTSGTKLKTSWITNQNAEPWKTLISNNGVKQRQLDVMAQMADRTYELPSVNAPTQKELGREDWSDFEDTGNDDDQTASSSAGAGTPAQGDNEGADEEREDNDDEVDEEEEDGGNQSDTQNVTVL
ncbi:hypothetical protein PPTG_22603 [Phytophthora nicotianae INRA-310]|uniref:Uncharacterized protein n=1 Tax=Phytophthora nicotianae (strain INRA-310) TaxID=761204 RepID=W2QEL1_PHYN3|nr:hypothetical protein PPTG_22603 [Phytophthora nicotianae INRA-310]ETN11633.1 hypothetical protein PPTG_22603 [Phytophthora nicotianae INRA-310]